jgi:hypothetical protein
MTARILQSSNDGCTTINPDVGTVFGAAGLIPDKQIKQQDTEFSNRKGSSVSNRGGNRCRSATFWLNISPFTTDLYEGES